MKDKRRPKNSSKLKTLNMGLDNHMQHEFLDTVLDQRRERATVGQLVKIGMRSANWRSVFHKR